MRLPLCIAEQEASAGRFFSQVEAYIEWTLRNRSEDKHNAVNRRPLKPGLEKT